MAFVIKTMKGIRNNWKKSTFALIALTYGGNYTLTYLETQELMREYCKRAAEYGKQPLPADESPQTVTVILNPNANKRKALKYYEKYCAPILNQAGMCIDVVQTQSEGHAKELVKKYTSSDTILVAGGDGTLSEVITGLLRNQSQSHINIPLGILPLGRCNTIASSFFPGEGRVGEVKSLADATMAVIEKNTKPVDVMKIVVVEEAEEIEPKPPIYALSAIEWGAYRDARSRRDNYWFLGPLRNYVTYLFNGYKSSLTWNCNADLNYTLPCEGCANCYISKGPKQNRRWYQRFWSGNRLPSAPTTINKSCTESHEKSIVSSNLEVRTTNSECGLQNSSTPRLRLEIGSTDIDYLDFVSRGWQFENGGDKDVKEVMDVRQVQINPLETWKQEKEVWFSIDKEEYEVKPVKVTLMPGIAQMYCKKN